MSDPDSSCGQATNDATTEADVDADAIPNTKGKINETDTSRSRNNTIAKDDDDVDTCGICLEPLLYFVLKMPCQHKLHQDCFLDYLEKHEKEGDVHCPYCRQNLSWLRFDTASQKHHYSYLLDVQFGDALWRLPCKMEGRALAFADDIVLEETAPVTLTHPPEFLLVRLHQICQANYMGPKRRPCRSCREIDCGEKLLIAQEDALTSEIKEKLLAAVDQGFAGNALQVWVIRYWTTYMGMLVDQEHPEIASNQLFVVPKCWLSTAIFDFLMASYTFQKVGTQISPTGGHLTVPQFDRWRKQLAETKYADQRVSIIFWDIAGRVTETGVSGTTTTIRSALRLGKTG